MTVPADNVAKALRKAGYNHDRLVSAEMTTSGNTTGEESIVAKERVDQPVLLDPSRDVDLLPVAYESFTTDGTGGNTETFNLAHDLVDSPQTQLDFLLFEAGNQVAADSVDFANNSFNYTDDGTNNTLHAYYVAREPGQAIIRKRAPGQIAQDVLTINTGRHPLRDTHEEPLRFSFESALGQALAPKWELQVVLDAPFSTQFADDTDTGAKALNWLVDIPVLRTDAEIEGLNKAVRSYAAEV